MKSVKGVSPDLYDEEYYCKHGLEKYLNLKDKVNLKDDSRELDSREKRLDELADAQPNEKILDVGCGRGDKTIRMAQRGAFITGIDYSKDAIRIFKLKIKTLPKNLQKKIKPYKMNAQKMTFKDNSFDKVTMFDVVEHLTDEELYNSMKEIKRVLKPGGTLVLHTAPDRSTKWLIELYKKFRAPSWKKKYTIHMHVNEKTRKEVKQILLDFGFDCRVWNEKVSNIYATGILKK